MERSEVGCLVAVKPFQLNPKIAEETDNAWLCTEESTDATSNAEEQLNGGRRAAGQRDRNTREQGRRWKEVAWMEVGNGGHLDRHRGGRLCLNRCRDNEWGHSDSTHETEQVSLCHDGPALGAPSDTAKTMW